MLVTVSSVLLMNFKLRATLSKFWSHIVVLKILHVTENYVADMIRLVARAGAPNLSGYDRGLLQTDS